MKTGIIYLLMAATLTGAQSEPPRISMPGSPFGICWGMVYGQPFAKSEIFMPQLRRLNAGFTRVILFWSQLEPEKGKYNWASLDAFLDQLQSPEEAILTIYSASPWATRNSTWVFPPSPARNADDYAHFISAVVTRAKGRIRYFQNDSEPNNPMFWAGNQEEFVGQLRIFAKAVRTSDPKAKVVLGGSDGLFDPSGTHALPGQEKSLSFFEYVIAHAGESFDIFDLHLYADPYTIPARVDFIRAKMAAHGYEKPIIAAESNGPGFFEFPVNRKYHQLMSALGSSVSEGVTALYADRDNLAPETQMFLQNAPPPLERKLQQLQETDLIVRTILALSVGIQKIAFWDLWHETATRDQVKTLMYGKLLLMQYGTGDSLSQVLPLGRAYESMASQLSGVDTVVRIPVPDQSIFAFRITRREHGPVCVVWDKDGSRTTKVSISQCGAEIEVTGIPIFLQGKL